MGTLADHLGKVKLAYGSNIADQAFEVNGPDSRFSCRNIKKCMLLPATS